MALSKFAEHARRHRSIAGRMVPLVQPCPVSESLFANISAPARALVRAAQRSPDKTVFVHGVELDRLAAEAEEARYLAPLRGAEGVFFITARGEAWLAARARVE